MGERARLGRNGLGDRRVGMTETGDGETAQEVKVAGAVGFMQLIAKEAHLAREQTEAVNTAILFAVLQQHLHADADAEEGLAQLSNALVLIVAVLTIIGELILMWIGKGKMARLREKQS